MLKSSNKKNVVKLLVEAEKNKNDSGHTKSTNELITTNVKKYVVGHDSFLQQQFETKEEDMIAHISTNDVWYGEQYLSWEIGLGETPLKYLPFLKVAYISNCNFEVDAYFSYFFSLVNEVATLKAGLVYSSDTNLKDQNVLKAKLLLAWDRTPLRIVETTEEIITVHDYWGNL